MLRPLPGRERRIDADRQVAAIIFDVDRPQPLRQFGQRFQAEQGMIGEAMVDQARLLRIERHQLRQRGVGEGRRDQFFNPSEASSAQRAAEACSSVRQT